MRCEKQYVNKPLNVMCGIFCEICHESQPLDDKLLRSLENRGPDSTTVLHLPGIAFVATLLWQQGAAPKVQPLESERFVLLFNGDCFMDRGDSSISDSEWLFERVHNSASILDLIKGLRGPLALVLYDKLQRKLYFFRDSLGRNSLLLGRKGETLLLASVMTRTDTDGSAVIELPALGVFVYDFSKLTLHPWQSVSSHEVYEEQLNELRLFLGDLCFEVADTITPDWRLAGEEQHLSYDFFEVCRGVQKIEPANWFEHFLENKQISQAVDRTIALLKKSIHDRIENSPKICKDCLLLRTASCQHARLAILFSGGLDCSLLATLADQLLATDIPIDLINVAFEKRSNQPAPTINWDVPDRVTARESHQQLQRLRPTRQWRLVEVNVTRAELNAEMMHISHLVYPLQTVLDESIGAALWFAARGHTPVYQTVSRVILVGSGADELFGGYTRHRNAYVRHNKTDAWPPNLQVLEDELTLDWVRLPSRNLARDDRVIADHGCTPRAPFVEEGFVQFVRQLRPEQKCCHALPPGVGDKLLLRLAAHRLGLSAVAAFKKRALQFGSRIADSRQNAKDRSAML